MARTQTEEPAVTLTEAQPMTAGSDATPRKGGKAWTVSVVSPWYIHAFQSTQHGVLVTRDGIDVATAAVDDLMAEAADHGVLLEAVEVTSDGR